MARLTSLIFLLALVSCQSRRPILICRIVLADSKGYCAIEDVQSERLYPEQMNGFYAWNITADALLNERMNDCEHDGKLPAGDATWEQMQVCVIGDNCGVLDDYFATDSAGAQKIQAKLDWCRKH